MAVILKSCTCNQQSLAVYRVFPGEYCACAGSENCKNPFTAVDWPVYIFIEGGGILKKYAYFIFVKF